MDAHGSVMSGPDTARGERPRATTADASAGGTRVGCSSPRLTSLRLDHPPAPPPPFPSRSALTATGFASVVLDVDSTLCGIEGIDWLAARRGPEAGVRIAELTDRAMNGELALDAVYGERLGVVRPSREDLAALAAAYERALAPGARDGDRAACARRGGASCS